MIDVFEILLRTYTCNNKIGTNNNRRVGAVEGMDGTDSSEEEGARALVAV